ncbi:MAG: hypothetical protein PHI27_02560 [Eubacteriales bacterium]|nr:hypothetical protein [Eubacteriales bacterium]MDD3881116.1 hypothetical protein [Eubacteriales bacterium]MDD4511498.1 hypothetical protein [Eubacteriales bacterium]
MKKLLAIVLSVALCLTAFGTVAFAEESVEDVIAQAQSMTNEELYKKAIEESNGKVLYGIGNSSRGKTAGAEFVAMLQGIDPSYTGTIEWSQPKNNSIFTTLNADIKSSSHIYSMTLIQDGNQIQSKMLNTGNLLNFIPKEWAEQEGVDIAANSYPLTLQTLNKVFMFNNTSGAVFTNCWDFVAEGVNPLYMDVNSELVGKNFLYMLTSEKYSTYLKDAFDKLPTEKKAYFAAVIDEVAPDCDYLGLTAENAKYGLAFIKLWCEQYNAQTDDGPICNTLVTASAAGQSGLLVYSKLRSVEESADASVNNITIAAYQDDYTGIGGYAYKHFLMLTKTSPLPWTACAFISFMTTTETGFHAWGKDMGGYSANPVCNTDHSKDGFVDGVDTYPAKDDRGYEWWTSAEGGQLVVEDPAYCAEVSFDLGDWIDMIIGNK